MKRVGNIYAKIYSIDNLLLADKHARKGKTKQPGVIKFDADKDAKILELHHMLKDKKYKTSAYSTRTVYEPKQRLVYILPYWPDRIAQWAIMLQLEPILKACYIANTYSCIKGRGIRAASEDLGRAMLDVPGTAFCLQMDVKKYYASVKHAILKSIIRRKIKDPDLLWLLDEIIDSAPGLPIGNFLSQHLGNYYLTPFDHFVKEDLGAPNYFRYMDDMVLLASNKDILHHYQTRIIEYLNDHLNLEAKSNYRIFPTALGINFVGFKRFHTHVLLRPSIKKRCARMLVRNRNAASIAGYNGWFGGANTINLRRKLAI